MTLDPGRIVDHLASLGVDLFTGVPDSLLKDFCAYVMDELPAERHVIAANEGAAVGIATGHYLRASQPALVYLQNSGIGNTVNPLLSLADPDVYGIPMLLLVGWRGQPGVKDEPQHVKQGRVMTALLDAMEFPWTVLSKESHEALRQIDAAVTEARNRSTPFVLLVEKNTFAPYETTQAAPSSTDLPSREDALVELAEAIGSAGIHVATTGMLGRELFEYRQRPGVGDSGRDFLTVGGMGHASSIALGIANSEPEREVWCFDGDGAALMHMGSLAVNAVHAPQNFFHVIFNNGVHDSVGGQPTVMRSVDVPALALSMGYRTSFTVSALADIPDAVTRLREEGGPSLLDLSVTPGNRDGIGRPTRTPADAKTSFMNAL